MADFAKRSVAACPGLGFEPDAFLAAFDANQRIGRDTAFDSNPIAAALISLLEARGETGWTGTATQLLHDLDAQIGPETRRDMHWPKTPAALGNQLSRAAPLLRDRGWYFARKHSGDRFIVFTRKTASD